MVSPRARRAAALLALLAAPALTASCARERDNPGDPHGINPAGRDGATPDSWRRPDAGKRDRGKQDKRLIDRGKRDSRPPADLPRPDSSGSQLKVLQVPLSLNFEAGKGGLVGTKDWEWGTAYKFNAKAPGCDNPTPPPKPHSGKGMWGTRLNRCYSPLGNSATSQSGSTAVCKNQNINDDSILRFRVKLPSGWPLISLYFYQWVDINYYFDWNEVRVHDGSGSKVLKQYCFPKATKPTAWVKQELYLDKYAGKTVTISFHFMASQAVNNAGWYIDDLSVKKPGP